MTKVSKILSTHGFVLLTLLSCFARFVTGHNVAGSATNDAAKTHDNIWGYVCGLLSMTYAAHALLPLLLPSLLYLSRRGRLVPEPGSKCVMHPV